MVPGPYVALFVSRGGPQQIFSEGRYLIRWATHVTKVLPNVQHGPTSKNEPIETVGATWPAVRPCMLGRGQSEESVSGVVYAHSSQTIPM